MAAINAFLSGNIVFDLDTTQALSMAFEQTCAALGLSDAHTRERHVIANRIIELARRGERDSDLIRDRVLSEAGLSPYAEALGFRR
jgi:hypothetical protein